MPLRLCLFLSLLLFGNPLSAQDLVRVEGSAAVVLPFTAAASVLQQQGLEVKVNAESNSPRAIFAVGEGTSDLAVSIRPVLAIERAHFPDRPLAETTLGYQALAFVVSSDVWEAGVRSLSRAQMRDIYEGKITEWKELGGPDRKIKFFNPEKGKGVWEFFATWLYDEVQKTPLGANFETVATAEETRNLVEFNGGALSVIVLNRAESKGTHALALRQPDGQVLAATAAQVRAGVYPLVRPVVMVTAFRPAGRFRRVIEFMTSAQGQDFVRKADIIPVQEEETE